MVAWPCCVRDAIRTNKISGSAQSEAKPVNPPHGHKSVVSTERYPVTRMNHELRNRQQRARERLLVETANKSKQMRLLDVEVHEVTRKRPRSYHCKRRDASRCVAKGCGETRPTRMRVNGTIGELKRMLWPLKLKGVWTSRPNGVWILRCSDRSVLSWAEGSGTLWCQGPDEAKRKLESRIRKLLEACGHETDV
jgi:hypothetical protein